MKEDPKKGAIKLKMEKSAFSTKESKGGGGLNNSLY